MTPDPRCPVATAARVWTPGDGDRRRRGLRSRSIVRVLLCAGFLALSAEGLDAQERVRVEGWVQWIGGANRMQVMTYGGSIAVDGRRTVMPFGGTVTVDLKDADQSSYQALRERDRVIVDGVISSDRRRVMAREIWRIGDSETEAP
jgi:hypothetical protein